MSLFDFTSGGSAMLSAYPSITTEEFLLACTALEQRCHDSLEGTNWRRVSWTGWGLQIQQTRSTLEGNGNSTIGSLEQSEVVDDLISNSDSDDGEFVREVSSTTTGSIDITFSIALSPTYSVPVLWFDAPGINSFDQLYRILVPRHLHDALADMGVLGGISQAYHPVTDMPSYFIHPCNTHQALHAVNDGRELSAEEYLLLWLGVIGSAVGLHVPSNLVANAQS